MIAIVFILFMIVFNLSINIALFNFEVIQTIIGFILVNVYDDSMRVVVT